LKPFIKDFLNTMAGVILQLTGKRKQALLESNLPGISCSTGMVKERVGTTNLSFQRIIPRAGCLKKLNQRNSVSTAVLYF
jgi:hypothetical protein